MEISSTQNNLVKHLVKIREEPKYRQNYKQIIVAGRILVSEIARLKAPTQIFITQDNHNWPSAKITYVTEPVLKKISGLTNPDGIAAVFDLPEQSALINKNRVLILESIADPGNLGTLLRTALAFGFDGVFVLGKSVDLFHEKVLRASRGALFSLSYHVGTWEELNKITKHNKAHCFVADLHGKPLASFGPQEKLFLLMSNEAQGVSPEAHNFGHKICIPMNGPMESLNVSIAGAILMYNLTSFN